MFNASNSAHFMGVKPIIFSEHPDLKGWDLPSKKGFNNAKAIKCYNLDEIAKLLGTDDFTPRLRTLASPDALIIEETTYTFVEFKTVTNFHLQFQGRTPTELEIKGKLREMVFKHLSAKIAGAAVFCTILANELHNQHYLTLFQAEAQFTKVYFVIDDVKKVVSFETQIKAVLDEFGSFGFKIEIHYIDFFMDKVLPNLKSVLKV